MKPRLPAGVWLLGLVSLLMDVSSEIISALLPLYLVGTLAVSTTVVGLIEAFGNATATITRLASGVWSDRIASRKGLAVVGYGLAAASKPLIPLTGSVTGIVAARCLDRIGKGVRTAPSDALVADMTPPGRLGEAFGLRKTMDTVGGFIGPLLAIGLMLAWNGDIVSVFWTATIPAVAAVAVLAIGVREPTVAGPRSVSSFSWTSAAMLTPAAWRAIAVASLVTLGRFGEAFLLLRAVEVGLAAPLVPLVVVVLHAFYACASYPAGRASDRVGRRPLVAAGLGVLMAAHAALGWASSLPVFWVGIGLWGVHMGLTQGVLSSLVADVTPAHLRGSSFGIQAIAVGFALVIGNVIAGWSWTAYGSQAAFGVAATAALAALVLVVSHPGPPKEPR